MRRNELDMCRVLACLMVLVIHLGSDAYFECHLGDPAFAVLNAVSTAVRPGVPLFFMLSGALFLGREKLDIKRLLVNNALRLELLFLLWSVLYAVISAVSAHGEMSVYGLAKTVLAGHYHLWFLHAMIMCYLFFPPVHAALHGYRLNIKYMLALFFAFAIAWMNLLNAPQGMELLTQIPQNFNFYYLMYIGYAVWGYWLDGRKFGRKTLIAAPLVYLVSTALASALNHWFSVQQETAFGWLFDYFSIPNFIEASAIFCFFLALRGHKFRSAKFMPALSDATLGVYLIHPMVLHGFRLLGLEIDLLHPVWSYVYLTILLTAVCFIPVLIAKRIPVIKKLL